MKSPSPSGVGIDVSKRTLDIALRYDHGDNHHFIVPNNAKGVSLLIRRLGEYEGRIVLESTGRYHLYPAFRLSERRLDVRVINPIVSRQYMTASVRKKKSDKADAAVLAHIAASEQNIPVFVANKENIHIRQKIGLLSSAERQLQAIGAMRRGYREFQGTMGFRESVGERQLKIVIRTLERQTASLQSEIQELVAQNPSVKSSCELARSIPGFSPFLASLLCQTLCLDCVDAKQWIHFVGLDVSVHQSGQWRGRGKLSKRGNAYIRKRLFNAAWGAAFNHPRFRCYYDKLRQEGRSYRESMMIIARKQLRILFVVLKTGVPFSEESCVFG